MIQYRDEGEVTIIVEYNDGYKHFFYYNVTKKVPTMVQDGDTVTFGKGADGSIQIYPAMGLCLTYDHRAVDGTPAAKFQKELCNNLENFTTLLAK